MASKHTLKALSDALDALTQCAYWNGYWQRDSEVAVSLSKTLGDMGYSNGGTDGMNAERETSYRLRDGHRSDVTDHKADLLSTIEDLLGEQEQPGGLDRRETISAVNALLAKAAHRATLTAKAAGAPLGSAERASVMHRIARITGDIEYLSSRVSHGRAVPNE